MSSSMGEVYSLYRDTDGFLYITYASQEMFGAPTAGLPSWAPEKIKLTEPQDRWWWHHAGKLGQQGKTETRPVCLCLSAPCIALHPTSRSLQTRQTRAHPLCSVSSLWWSGLTLIDWWLVDSALIRDTEHASVCFCLFYFNLGNSQEDATGSECSVLFQNLNENLKLLISPTCYMTTETIWASRWP